MATVAPIHIAVPVDADMERARIAISNALERYRDNLRISDALDLMFSAMCAVNAAIYDAKPRVMTQDEEDTLLSAIAEADREVRRVPTAEIDTDYVRERLTEALAQLPRKDDK